MKNKILNFLFVVYKGTLSPFFKSAFGGGCRYSENCSDYSVRILKEEGFIKGSILSFKRFLSCNAFVRG